MQNDVLIAANPRCHIRADNRPQDEDRAEGGDDVSEEARMQRGGYNEHAADQQISDVLDCFGSQWQTKGIAKSRMIGSGMYLCGSPIIQILCIQGQYG